MDAASSTNDDEKFPNTDPLLRHPSDDGTHVVEEGVEEVFAKWFHDNGGSYPKIQWPSRDTMGQVRGTIATDDIHTNEPMLYVPENIMISPPICKANPLIGHVFTENEDFFARDDDTMLAVFVMFEKERGHDSFWYPYLAMLPWPCSVADWSPTELNELQDRRLMQEATMRPVKLKKKYNLLMTLLCDKYSDLFSKETFTLEKYVFAWMTIQARAFGRRIPWTALVPFADCLNHTNVQTKYDFNVEHFEGVFRLYPTGENQYLKGAEVFNSYGRRDNRFLLMEYGFSLYENEWDTINISLNLKDEHAEHPLKLELLQRFNVSSKRSFRLRHGRLNQDFLSMCRLSAMSKYEMEDRRNELRFWSEGVSIVNELEAHEVYMNMLFEVLSHYPTTFEEDELILKSEPADQRLVAATRYRHCKKRILHNHISMLQTLLPLMKILKEQELSKLKTNNPKGLQVNYLEKYLSTVMTISMRGPGDQDGRLTEEDLLKQAAEKEEEQRLKKENNLAYLDSSSSSNSGGQVNKVEHKAYSYASDVVVTHPNGRSENELLRLKKDLANALQEQPRAPFSSSVPHVPSLSPGRSVKSGGQRQQPNGE